MQYFFSTDGTNQQGPLECDRLLAAGVRAETMVWREGLLNWTAAGQLPELADLFPADPAPLAVAPVMPEPSSFQPPFQPSFQPQYETPGVPPSTSGMAIASLVLGIIGLIACCSYLPSILAVVFGHIARAETRRTGRPGSGMATAGLVLGYIGLLLGVLLIIGQLFGAATRMTTTNFNSPPVFTPPPVLPVRP